MLPAVNTDIYSCQLMRLPGHSRPWKVSPEQRRPFPTIHFSELVPAGRSSSLQPGSVPTPLSLPKASQHRAERAQRLCLLWESKDPH